MTIEVYSDISCPWCYIGETRLKAALADFAQAGEVEVVFRPYQLDPSASSTPRPLKEQLAEKFGPRTDAMLRHVSSVATKEGLALNWDKAMSVNTIHAHRLLWFAEREGGSEVQQQVAEKLFEAHFTNGLSVGDVDVLVSIAESAGLDADKARTALESDEGLKEVQAEITVAQRFGITAVPTFIFDGKYAVQGAQPAETFRQVLEETLKQPVEVVEEGSDAACSDGSCAV